MGKREDIFDAALDIIIEHGIRGLTLPLLFEVAKTGSGTFYHYFKGTEALVDELYAHCCEIAEEAVNEKDDESLPVRERFDNAIMNIFQAHRDYPRELRFIYWYAYGVVVPDAATDRPVPSIVLLGKIIEKAQEEGLATTGSPAIISARMIRGMVASCLWGHEHDFYVLTEEGSSWFAKRAWHLIENAQF
ncbi:MAG: TetR/AcrR family transcriptional regulator [Coriobacteriia bacterium]|nr:TetR/AcrR family transcriptional regulator [Coriobacteriia bacterium]